MAIELSLLTMMDRVKQMVLSVSFTAHLVQCLLRQQSIALLAAEMHVSIVTRV